MVEKKNTLMNKNIDTHETNFRVCEHCIYETQLHIELQIEKECISFQYDRHHIVIENSLILYVSILLEMT